MAEKTVAVLIITNLILGILLAVGHHLFYASLDGRIVESLSQQEWYLRIGTGLSFLIRAFLSASIGSAYIQILWQNLRSTTISIKGVDALLGVLHNIRDLALWELWRTRPMLTIVALVIWALPLIAVVTPATLTVGPTDSPREDNRTMPVPVPEYANYLRYAQWGDGGGNYYIGPSSRISRLISSVASTGTVSTIPAPFPNSSYSMEFFGPAIECENLDPSTSALAQSLNQNVTDYGRVGGVSLGYVGFAPNCLSSSDADCDANDTVAAISGLGRTLNSEVSSGNMPFDYVSTDYAKLYVIAPDPTLAYTGDNFTTIRCGLFNSSYSGTITFINGQQVLDFSISRKEGLLTNPALSCDSSQASCDSIAAYLSIFDALGRILLGMIRISHYGFATPDRTQILTSVLMQTRELQQLPEINREQAPLTIANMSMTEALEQIFTNATLSLLSDSYFLQNGTMASMKTVIVRSPQNVYRYTSRNLVIAYSLGCGVTSLIVTIGLMCILSASASYSITFSTILRTTQQLHLDPGILSAETSGANPLSKRLAKTRVIFRRQFSTTDDGASQTWSFSVAGGQSAETVKLRETASVDESA